MEKSNIFILGSGRSGTSLVAGLFRNSGLFLGNEFYKPRDSNPLGFFEDRTVNEINEEILKPYLPDRFMHDGINYSFDSPVAGQRWLSRIPLTTNIVANENIITKIEEITSIQPFCFKDPRFSYTLNVWRKYSNNTKYICVFRDPGIVVSSVVKEIRSVPYLKNLALSVDQAFEVWRLMYQHILYKHSGSGEWLFLNYDDLFQTNTLDRIEQFTRNNIDKNFPKTSLNRSSSEFIADSDTLSIYRELLIRAK